MSPAVDREGSKWDRAARLLRVATVLHAHPAGISAQAIADQIGVSKRTVYRDLSRWRSTPSCPSGRTRASGASNRASSCRRWRSRCPRRRPSSWPPGCWPRRPMSTTRSCSRRTSSWPRSCRRCSPSISMRPSTRTRRRPGTSASRASCGCSPRRGPSAGWWRSTYGPGVYELDKPPRVTRVRPYAIEPSAFTRALYLIGLDEGRKARRTFKVERILEASLTPETFEGSSTTIARELLAAWDVISDEPMVRVVVRFSPEVAARVAETSWHPGQTAERQAGRLARLERLRLGAARGAHLDPGLGRRRRGPGTGRAARLDRRGAGPGSGAVPLKRAGPLPGSGRWAVAGLAGLSGLVRARLACTSTADSGPSGRTCHGCTARAKSWASAWRTGCLRSRSGTLGVSWLGLAPTDRAGPSRMHVRCDRRLGPSFNRLGSARTSRPNQ